MRIMGGYWYFLLLLLLTCLHLTQGVQQVTNPRIIEHPEDQYVAKNEPATLNCKAEGDPPPIITWYRNGHPVITANEDPKSNRMLLPSGQLFFLRIIHNKNSKPDVGVYYCNATNPETRVSVVSRNATLDLAVIRDDFEEHPRNTEVAVGDTAVLECRPPRGNPDPRVKWQKDGDEVRPVGRIDVQDSGSLVLRDAQHNDAGIYVCIAYSIAGERESSPARLMVREKPKIMKKPQEITVEEHRNVQFQCQAIGDPPPTIVWRREEGQVPHSRSEILTDSSLKISRVRVMDEGLYVCRAENSVGYVEAMARLTVHSDPTFLVTPRDKTVGVGRRVSFRCEVIGNPPPAVFWSKDPNKELMFPRQDNGRFSVTDDGTLVIEPVQKEDTGKYMCQALSVAGSAYAEAALEVTDFDPRPPPIIHQGPQNQTLPINSVAMLQCSASGDPPPTIRWYKDNRILTQRDPRLALLDSGTLQISDLRRPDTGFYTCKAMSETGDTSWGAGLIVEAPTDHTVIFRRTPEPSTFPGPPSKPSLSDITETSMRLTWRTNPNHGASPVFAYTVEYFSHETGEGWLVASDTITDQYYVVQNLQPGTAYMFLVRAQNSHGLSLPSQVTAPIKTTGSVPGHRPTVPQLDIDRVTEKLSGKVIKMKSPEAKSSTAIKLSWDLLKSQTQHFIEGYHIKYRIMPDLSQSGSHGHHHHVEYTIETIDTPHSREYTLRNLRKYTWYEIRIQPFYMSVEGQESNTVRIRTYEDVPSAAPQKVKANLLDNTTLHLSWKPPPHESRNGPLKGYRIYIYGNETKFNREIEVNESVQAIIVNHLVRDMAYRIQVAAKNRMGNGKKCDPVLIGGAGSGNLAQNFVGEPWFIATLIGTIGGTLWLALCVFSIWLYRKRRARKKCGKSGVVTVPVQKSEDVGRLGGMFSNQPPAPPYPGHEKEPSNRGTIQSSMNQSLSSAPDLDPSKENLYNLPHTTQPPMKTFYNKANAVPVAPYATTTLINAALQQQGDSAFRPIHPGYVQQGNNGSCSELGQKNGMHCDLEAERLQQEFAQAGACYQCGLPITECDCGNYTADEDTGLLNPIPGAKGPVLFLPPPPEHPPPSDVGTPPDSPTLMSRHGPPHTMAGYYSDHKSPYPEYAAAGHYNSDGGDYHLASHDMGSMDYRGSGGGGGVTYPRGMYSDSGEQRMHHPQQMVQHNRPPSPKFRTMSPRMQQDSRAYSPRAMSEPERGPTPPVRAYKLVPIRDDEIVHRHYSDTEGNPAPPMRMMVPHTPPSPAPEDPMMDRGIQSSLPSLANGGNPGQDRVPSPTSDLDGGVEYVGDSDLENVQPGSPVSSVDDVDTVTGSMLASWASVTDNSDSNCSSVHASGADSSDGSFFAEADFASAVAKAAELSGLTVVGSTVIDPNAGREKEKVKKSSRHRQRAKRPTSPYSTDSNYSHVHVPHKPYPKSERKRQLQAHGNRQRGPAVRPKPQHSPQVGELQSYPRASSGNPGNSGTAASRGSLGSPQVEGGDALRTNPMAAFDTRDTPIV